MKRLDPFKEQRLMYIQSSREAEMLVLMAGTMRHDRSKVFHFFLMLLRNRLSNERGIFDDRRNEQLIVRDGEMNSAVL